MPATAARPTPPVAHWMTRMAMDFPLFDARRWTLDVDGVESLRIGGRPDPGGAGADRWSPVWPN